VPNKGVLFLFFINAFHRFINPLVQSNTNPLIKYNGQMARKPKERRNRYGAWLHHLRTQKGLSQDALSELTGVPQSTLAYWEKTGKLTGRETIFKLAKALGVSVKVLLRADD
jgi:DNA-binding transcriptional regulator YiaG